MNFRSYSRLNNIIGWIVFAIAAFTYLATMERTVSLWDCGEFISTSYKLEITHPPGAPFFLLLNRFFTMWVDIFSLSPKVVPLLVNASSALASAFTILFLFWTITALALKLLVKDEENMAQGNIFAILGAGAVGALAYTFSDTFWFSAVEGEVYALSSMFTALIFWVALKWERRAHERHHLRWIVLIFYLTGLVIGVHLLGLLVIPVVVLMYYFKKYNVTRNGTLIAIAIGFAALGAVQIGVIQSLLRIAAKFDLVFVNSFGLPFWSGVIFFFILILALIAYGIYYSVKKHKVLLNLAMVCLLAVIMGYSSYAMTVIRSYANPPIDMNDPQDVYSLISYLSREQYGDSYLLTGPYYPAYLAGDRYEVKKGSMQYRKETDKYEETGEKLERDFKPEWSTVFPRMYSPQDNHMTGYRIWTNIGRRLDENGRESWEDENPGFRFSFIRHNLKFFFKYQMNYMYWRFFAWNFIGRQNDIQGTQAEFHQGNWMTGIPFIDEAIGNGPQKDIPEYLRVNKAKNALFGLPFILGLLGLYFQYKRHKKDFVVTFAFFFMTGLAIAIYLNMPSPQPRERDYAFVGSFYVFAIWIGLGVLYIYDLLRSKMPANSSAIAATSLCLVAVPVLMAAQEWNDHDRSKRFTSLDYGVNYLESCAPNAVLFCNGDNDTYPLWYAQEVEGTRDDIRIVNLSLLSTDWYINAMRNPINKAPGLKFTLSPEQTLGWDYIQYDKGLASAYDQNVNVPVSNFISFIADKSKWVMTYGGDRIPFLPTRKLRIPVDREKVMRNGTVRPEQKDLIVDNIDFDLNRTSLLKSDVMVLDFIATNNWDNPIYFSITSGPNEYLNLGKYLQQEGLAYRLVPVRAKDSDYEGQDTRIATDIMYNNVMNKFKWGKLDENEAFVDYVTSRQCNNMRGIFARLARTLLIEGKKDEAVAVIDKALTVIPEKNVPYDFYVVPMAEIYYRAGQAEKGLKLSNHLADILIEELNYYSKLERKLMGDVGSEIQRGVLGLRTLMQLAEQSNQTDLVNKIKPNLDSYQQRFMMEM